MSLPLVGECVRVGGEEWVTALDQRIQQRFSLCLPLVGERVGVSSEEWVTALG